MQTQVEGKEILVFAFNSGKSIARMLLEIYRFSKEQSKLRKEKSILNEKKEEKNFFKKKGKISWKEFCKKHQRFEKVEDFQDYNPKLLDKIMKRFSIQYAIKKDLDTDKYNVIFGNANLDKIEVALNSYYKEYERYKEQKEKAEKFKEQKRELKAKKKEERNKTRKKEGMDYKDLDNDSDYIILDLDLDENNNLISKPSDIDKLEKIRTSKDIGIER